MTKDVPSTAAGQTGSLFREIVQSKTWKRAFFFGAVAGVVAGVLNFAATAFEWPLQWLFECLNTPLIYILENPYYQFNPHSWAHSGPWNYLLRQSVVFICYWTIIGLVLAPVYYFVRAGIIGRIRRDQVCRGALILCAGGGVLMGGLNFLAALDVDGALANCFEVLDRPGIAVVRPAMYRPEVFQILQNASTEFICGFILAIAYWTTIGLLLATVFSFVRVLRMRNDGMGITVSTE